jgi:CubicO group peptidase (beta-lactamase class C family)
MYFKLLPIETMLTRRALIASLAAILVDGDSAFASAKSLSDLLRAVLQGTRTPALGALIVRKGRVDEFAAVGIRRIGEPEPVKLVDSWLIGSCGKPITTTLIARLIDKRLLSWSAPLSDMLPDLRETMRADYAPVTLMQLLSHRSGLPRGDELVSDAMFLDDRPLPLQRMDFMKLALEESPLSPPGREFHYSNTGFIAAAAIAERAAGVPYEELMRQEVFGPLGMSSAAFTQPAAGELSGHQDGRPATPKDSGPALYHSNGLMRMTLQDWARFAIDQLAGAKGKGDLLSAASYRLMQSPMPGSEDALTWGFDATLSGRKGPVLSHTGTDRNWFASINLFLDSGDAILLACNAGKSMGGDMADNAAFKALLPTVSTPV